MTDVTDSCNRAANCGSVEECFLSLTPSAPGYFVPGGYGHYRDERFHVLSLPGDTVLIPFDARIVGVSSGYENGERHGLYIEYTCHNGEVVSAYARGDTTAEDFVEIWNARMKVLVAEGKASEIG